MRQTWSCLGGHRLLGVLQKEGLHFLGAAELPPRLG
jgi:hypothetical protein